MACACDLIGSRLTETSDVVILLKRFRKVTELGTICHEVVQSFIRQFIIHRARIAGSGPTSAVHTNAFERAKTTPVQENSHTLSSHYETGIVRKIASVGQELVVVPAPLHDQRSREVPNWREISRVRRVAKPEAVHWLPVLEPHARTPV